MVRARYMVPVVGLGGVFGLAVGWLVWGRELPADVTVSDMLIERCIPYVGGGQPNTDGLIPVYSAGDKSFADPTGVVVSFEQRFGYRHCRISDVLALWTNEQRLAVFEAARSFAIEHVASMNSGDFIEEDVTASGVGDPQITWRRPDMTEGYYVGFIRLRNPEDLKKTVVSFGKAKFVRPANVKGGSDA